MSINTEYQKMITTLFDEGWDEGYDVYITHEGSRTKYSVKLARNPSELQMDDNKISIVFKGLKPKKAAVEDTLFDMIDSMDLEVQTEEISSLEDFVKLLLKH